MTFITSIQTFLSYVNQNSPEIWTRVEEHLQLTLLAVCSAVLIGVPLGILISYVKTLKKPVIGIANVVQAVPSLALLGFLIPWLGIGQLPAVFMVIIYSLLPIVKNTTTGIDSISAEMTEAAKGIGMTQLQILFKVKLPLALPVIMAGVRISAVTAVGLVTIAAFIGAGGLGYLVYSGIRTVNNYLILAGAIPACIMALAIDFIAALIEKAVTPLSFTEKIMVADSQMIRSFKKRKKVTVALTSFLLILILSANFFSGEISDRRIILGAKDFTEQNILGNIYAEMIKAHTDIDVDLKAELSSQVIFSALTNDELDLYIDYTGTVYGSVLGHTEILSAEEVYAACVRELKETYDVDMLETLGFNNTYTLSVGQDTAEKYGLESISDLAQVSKQLVLGAGFEILNRNDGIPNLEKAYDLTFKEKIAVEGTPRYTALKNEEVQVIDAFATDGMVEQFALKVLKDDKSFFPAYDAAPVIRPEVLQQYPELLPVLKKLQGCFSDDVMRKLNYKVDGLKMNPRDVAMEFLQENNLI